MASIVTKETGISIGLGVLILAGILFSERRMSAMEHTHELESQAINLKLDAITARMDARTGDRWTASDFTNWCDLLAARNEGIGLVVPMPKASE